LTTKSALFYANMSFFLSRMHLELVWEEIENEQTVVNPKLEFIYRFGQNCSTFLYIYFRNRMWAHPNNYLLKVSTKKALGCSQQST
jgi:hypothetical protein